MDIQIVEECSRLSEAEKITFPEVVARLNKAGVESYVVNMLVPNKIYYADNESCEMPLQMEAEKKCAEAFDQEGVIGAIRASQAGKIGYQEFLRRILDAGVIYYLVFIKGRKAIYVGRKGEQHCELFPSK